VTCKRSRSNHKRNMVPRYVICVVQDNQLIVERAKLQLQQKLPSEQASLSKKSHRHTTFILLGQYDRQLTVEELLSARLTMKRKKYGFDSDVGEALEAFEEKSFEFLSPLLEVSEADDVKVRNIEYKQNELTIKIELDQILKQKEAYCKNL
jgi:hypothetical protein